MRGGSDGGAKSSVGCDMYGVFENKWMKFGYLQITLILRIYG